jgi:hypothetical protein
MKQSEANDLNMVQAVLANLKNDQSYWSDEPEIVSEVAAIETEYNLIIGNQNIVSGLDPTGYTKTKNTAFERIILSTYKLCRKLCIYARRQNDEVLLKLADHTENTLSAGIEKDAISRCIAIVDKAESMLRALSGNKVTADELAKIRQLIVVYNQQLDTRSTVKTNKTVSIQNISVRVALLVERLTLLDDMVEGYIEDEGMIARYKASRIIIKYGKGKTVKKKAEKPSTKTPAS